MILHTKFQGSIPYCFRQDTFLLIINLCKTCDPRAGVILAQGHRLGGGPPDDAACQYMYMEALERIVLYKKIFLKSFLQKSILKKVSNGAKIRNRYNQVNSFDLVLQLEHLSKRVIYM